MTGIGAFERRIKQWLQPHYLYYRNAKPEWQPMKFFTVTVCQGLNHIRCEVRVGRDEIKIEFDRIHTFVGQFECLARIL